MKKNILITGCSRGLGKYLVNCFPTDKFNIIGIGLKNESKIEPEIINKLTNYYCFNLRDIDKIPILVQKIINGNNHIDILINNAGLKYFKIFKDINVEDFEKVFKVNFFAPIVLIKELLPEMIKRKSGKIINISSNAAIRGYSKGTLYCSSKSALLKFSQALSEEIEGTGVSILTICPSTLSTDEYLDKYPNVKKNKLVSPKRIYKIIKNEINTSRNKSLLIITPKMKLKYIVKNITRSIFNFIAKEEL